MTTAEDVLLDKAVVGDDVVILGAGSVGVETAEFLVERGKNVTVVEMTDDILQDMAPTLRAPLETRIRKTPTRFELGQKVLEIRGGEVVTDKATFGPFQTVSPSGTNPSALSPTTWMSPGSRTRWSGTWSGRGRSTTP